MLYVLPLSTLDQELVQDFPQCLEVLSGGGEIRHILVLVLFPPAYVHFRNLRELASWGESTSSGKSCVSNPLTTTPSLC